MIGDEDIARIARAMRRNGVAALKTPDVEMALVPGWQPRRPVRKADESAKAKTTDDDAILFASVEGFPE